MSRAQHDRRIDYIEINATDVARAKQSFTDAFGSELAVWTER